MQLFFNHASPFSRKCRVLAVELGIEKDIDWQDVGVLSPLDSNEHLLLHNPLTKLPILRVDDQQVLCDSRVICEYFLELKGEGHRFAERELYFRDLHLQVLADGLMDAALLIRYETMFRETSQQWQAWQQKQWFRIDKVLSVVGEMTDSFERDGAGRTVLEGHFTLGQIALVCAVGYLDFRFPQYPWRKQYGALSSWLEWRSSRRSVKETIPY